MTPDLLSQVAAATGTPVYIYDESRLRAQAITLLRFPAPYGLTARFAMKACPTAAILRLFREIGLAIDASSGFEVRRALRAGFSPGQISLSTQELPEDFAELVSQGVQVNACSLSQLQRLGSAFPGHPFGLRFNPGLGSGGTGKTNVGGPSSSFGIWHEYADEAAAIAAQYNLNIFRIHTHIGSGSDPVVWQRVAQLSLGLVGRFSAVTHLNLGGGYKVGRMAGEVSTDLLQIGTPVALALEEFAASTGRRIHLEVEPGTFLLANSGYLLARVQDVVDTGASGHRFLKLDAGMTEILRPSLYAAQHPITIFPAGGERVGELDYVVVGHCCESGDLLSPDPGDSEKLSSRRLPETRIGDLCLIGGAGAYCSAMSTTNYNSFPQAPEVLLGEDGGFKVIRQRQTLEQMLANEV